MTGLTLTDPRRAELLAAAHVVQALIKAADEHDPEFYWLLNLALAEDQLDANEVLVRLVWAESTGHKGH